MISLEETNANGQVQTGDVDQQFDFTTSDFAVLVATTAFVDKTLLIRDIFYGSSKILITAPPKFGKSTNIDMVKRFLEIEVDTKGVPKTVHETMNYWLFKDNNLEICKHESFFNKHFGKHPVIYIDCAPLGGVNDFGNMLNVFRSIVTETFNQHAYLLNKTKTDLFNMPDCFDINDFKKHFSKLLINKIDEEHLLYSFKYLSTILYRYFGTQVFVLIDNCDAFVKIRLVKYSYDRNKIFSFIITVMDNLLKNNNCVERAVLTGVLPTIGVGLPFYGNNIDSHCFLNSYIFYKYYGLTSDELDKILGKLVDDTERNSRKREINEFYEAYNAAGNNQFPVYSIWSVLQYLYRKQVQNYWCHHEGMLRIKLAFNIPQIREKTEHLLLGKSLQLDISQTLSAEDMFGLDLDCLQNTLNVCDIERVASAEVNNFFIVLYHFGYLTIDKILGCGSVSLKIPNEEIKSEFAKILLETNQSHYYDSKEDVEDIISVIESFQQNSTNHQKNFAQFSSVVLEWSNSLKHAIKSENDFLTRLFLILITRPEYRKTVLCEFGMNNNPLVIVVKNTHHVFICITAEESTANPLTAEAMKQSAENAHKNVLDNTDGKVFFDICTEFYVGGRVLIGISYGMKGTKYVLGNAHSHYFVEGDNLEQCTTDLYRSQT